MDIRSQNSTPVEKLWLTPGHWLRRKLLSRLNQNPERAIFHSGRRFRSQSYTGVECDLTLFGAQRALCVEAVPLPVDFDPKGEHGFEARQGASSVT